MATVEPRPPVQPGEPAPDFVLPAVDQDRTVSLADYRGRTPVLLALMRGLYCAFCRRHIAHLAGTRRKLGALGIDVLAVVATAPERARLYYRFRPVAVPLAADPELTTHRAYGLPNCAPTPQIWQVIGSKYAELARDLRIPATDMAAIQEALAHRDGYEAVAADQDDIQRHRIQFVGQFLIDRGGIIRWTNIEGAKEDLAGMERFPTDEEVLAAAQRLKD